MKRKILVIISLLLTLGLFIGCGGSNDNKKEEENIVLTEINKDDYEKADFVSLNLNAEEYKKLVGKKVFVEGEVSAEDIDGKVFDKSPNLTVTQKEGEGYGIYAAKGYNIKDSGLDIKDKDIVKVYGIVNDERITGMPTILVDKIEKN